MQKLSTPFKVGFVILLGIVVTIVMIIRFSADWGQKNGIIELHAYFNDATGLAIKSQVKVAGIQVGEVTSITLEGQRAHIIFNVRQDVALYNGILEENNFHRNGATVSKKLSGILGDYHLELTPGLEGNQLQNGDTIPNIIQAGGAEALLNDAGKIMKDISDVTQTLSTVFGGDDGQQKISILLDDLNSTMKNVKGLTEDNAQKISSIIAYTEVIAQNAADISSTGNEELPKLVEDLNDVLADLKYTMTSVRNGVDDTMDSAHGGIDQLRASIEKLDNTLSHIENIASNIENGQGTVGKILKDDSIANEAQSLLAETRELIKSGTKTVDGANALLKPISDLDVDISLRGDYLVNANAFKVDFGVKLIPSPSKFYYLGLVMDPHGTTTTKSILTDSSVSGPEYETITTNDDSIKFNLQYGVRWKWFAGRFGIIENTGGLGGDILLFDDDWRFSFDLFAFNDNEFPRLRGVTLLYLSLFMPDAWKWSKSFYISAGFDNPFNTKIFDYFFGVGFRFTDNDVKSIIGLMPKP